MVVNNFNEDSDVGLTYQGFFTITDTDDSEKYRYKSLIEASIITNADFEKYYSDAGAKRMKSLGDSSTFSIRTKKSADLWSVNSLTTTTESRTIGYYQNKIYNERVIPLLEFEGVQLTDAASNAYIVQAFTAFVLNIEDTRNPQTGVPEVVISGEIKTMDKSNRQASAPT